MARTNGKSDIAPHLDTDHELPAGDENEATSTADQRTAGAAEVDRDLDAGKLRAERDMLIERLQRLQAEFENARKRAAREQQDFREYATADALKALLPIVDSFERALATSKEKSEFRSGVELISKQLQDALGKLGLRPLVAKGNAFDPHLHEAVEMVDTTEVPDHHVIEELQRGYTLKDRLLRPAMVKVARNPKH